MINDALSSSGGGGGGGGSAPDPQWYEAYSQDFGDLPDANLDGDGDKVIDGHTWKLGNFANAISADVGGVVGGIRLTVDPAVAARHYLLERTAAYFSTKIAPLLVGTDAEGRSDIEMRFVFGIGYTGAPGGTYNGLCFGLSSDVVSANYHHYIRQGHWANNGTNLDRIQTNGPGTLIAGLQHTTELSTPALAYYPKFVRISYLRGGYRLTEYSDAAATTPEDAVWSVAAWESTALQQLPQLLAAAANSGSELTVWFGIGNYYGTGGYTSITLENLRVQFRVSPGYINFLT